MSHVTEAGVPGVGAIPWGSHFCHFYDEQEDLADTLVPFFKAGLDRGEACLWITAEPLPARAARAALAASVPDFDERERRGQIEIVDHRDWYLRAGHVDAEQTLQGWIDREAAALARGFSGLRLSGNVHWLTPGQFPAFIDYERAVNDAFASSRIVALCSYCAGRCRAHDVLDVVDNHRFTVVRRAGVWSVLESAATRLAREDLARVQRAAEELRELDRRKDQFIAMLGHELRNPLAPVRTALDILRRRGAGGRELEIADRNLRHVIGLVNDLLDVAGIVAGRMTLPRERTDVARVVADAVEQTRAAVEKRGHSVSVEVPCPPPFVDGDPRRLTQVVANLVDNAAKYTPPDRIDVVVTAAGGEVVIEVRDRGPGMPADLLPRAFEPFTQGPRGLERAVGGLGLGLQIVRGLVELHGGRVDLSSSAAGTTVAVRLPEARAPGLGP
jgi:signal transduction histidine kinase